MHRVRPNVSCKKSQDLGAPITVRYGLGSPFLDIVLPCGGALEVTLIHAPDQKTLTELLDLINQREARTLQINCKAGSLSIHPHRSKNAESAGDIPPIVECRLRVL